MKPIVNPVKAYLYKLQDALCQMLVTEDGTAQFKEDIWQKTDGQGGGITRVMENGTIIEKAGVNFSHVYGQLPPAIIKEKPELKNHHYQAMGISTVIHPRNPYAPTAHMNVRFFVAEKPGHTPIWWFGGGFDLTPYYGFSEDCIHWHTIAKQACDPFGKDVYAKYKKACDEYFFLKHRNEPRGIGGIFFDHLNEWGFAQCFAFMQSVGKHFMQAYQPILARRKNLSFSEREREFQHYRRGRYVEFNLIHDRGTLFGLETNGRTESILISLPPQVTWRYDFKPQPDSQEARLYEEFLIPKDWLAK